MKLIIQVPCLDEQDQLPICLAELPREVEGFETVEWLIVDDGSTDRTTEVARAHGVDHVVRLPNNKGLAMAFQAGLDACVKLGADVIVNTDADNQYSAADIPALVAPILAGRAEIVVGDREVETIEHFSALKKRLQRLGSWVINQASATDIPDATSGFRAYSREAALGLTIVSTYTYTLESLIQAGKSRSAIDHVPVGTNEALRESRLFPSMGSYLRRNVVAIVRIYTGYEPLRVFTTLAVILFVLGIAAWTPFLWDWLANGESRGHLQSVVLGAVFVLSSVQVFALGFLADTIASHRAVSQRVLQRVSRLEAAAGVEPPYYEHPEAAPRPAPAAELLDDAG